MLCEVALAYGMVCKVVLLGQQILLAQQHSGFSPWVLELMQIALSEPHFKTFKDNNMKVSGSKVQCVLYHTERRKWMLQQWR